MLALTSPRRASASGPRATKARQPSHAEATGQAASRGGRDGFSWQTPKGRPRHRQPTKKRSVALPPLEGMASTKCPPLRSPSSSSSTLDA
eukprot:14972428-Alexandrium_andersonii.AAC.1